MRKIMLQMTGKRSGGGGKNAWVFVGKNPQPQSSSVQILTETPGDRGPKWEKGHKSVPHKVVFQLKLGAQKKAAVRNRTKEKKTKSKTRVQQTRRGTE